MKLVLLSKDLMISSLVAGAAARLELTVVTMGSPAAAVEAAGDEEAGVVVVDLRLPGLNIAVLVDSIRSECERQVPVVAFGPHVHEDSLTKARDAGCDVVATRGQFDREAVSIISQLLAG